MEWAGRRVLVMGLGRFGGGAGVVRFLVERGAKVTVTDMNDATALAGPLDELSDLAFDTRLGEHRFADFTAADTVVVNPAVNPYRNEFVRAARDAGATITTEIRILIEQLPNQGRGPGQVVGITGTAGKSTATAMLGHILRQRESPPAAAPQPSRLTPQAARRKAQGASRKPQAAVHIGGNLGGSLLPRVDAITADDVVVLELSSFMLEHLAAVRWSPPIAVVTHFAANHLDWHGSVEAYQRAKQAILDHQQPGDTAVLGPTVADWPVGEGVRREAVDQPMDGPLMLPGEHNRWNAALAVAAAERLGVERAAARQVLGSFPGLAHRLEWLGEAAGVRCFNDSKATTPEAAMLALASFDTGRVHLILGGYDKASDLAALADRAARRAAGVYTIGETGPALAEAITAADPDAPVHRCGDLDTAVRTALTQARAHPEAVLLLSPGCASWDQFTHYESRGERFRDLVQQHAGRTGTRGA